jgi:type II secretory pathway component PulF
MATLLNQRIPILDAIQIASNSIGSNLIRNRLGEVSNIVANGEKFHKALSLSSLFSPFMINILSVGEEGGRLEQALDKVADIYQTEISTTTKRITALIEPTIIFLLAIGLGFIIFAIIIPIFQLELFEI